MEQIDMKLQRAILHTEVSRNSLIKAIKGRKERKIIRAYMKAWDGVRVTVSTSSTAPGEYSVVGWPPEEEERAKEAIYLMEQDPMFGQYINDREGFEADWESGKWSPSGSIIFPPEMVEIISGKE